MMSLGSNLHSNSTDAIPSMNCTVTSQSDLPAANESTQIVVNGTTANNNAAIENTSGKRSEDALPTNQGVNYAEAQNENERSKISVNDSEPIKELKESNNTETTLEENSKNEKPDEKCIAPVSIPENKKDRFLNTRIAKYFKVLSSNKMHKDGKVNKIFFGTVENLVPGKEELWRILYDDGDVDIIPRANLLDAIKYYAMNQKYDTKHAKNEHHSSMLQESDQEDDAARSTTIDHNKNFKGKTSPPKKGNKPRTKVARKEQIPEWIGPPDEKIDGGWPEGVSTDCISISAL